MELYIALTSMLLLACVYGSPVPEKNLEKRRESTPEILGLEQELKKAAGENKQYFSNPDARPMPQIDGLDRDNEELQKSAAGQQPPQPLEQNEPQLDPGNENDISNEEESHAIDNEAEDEEDHPGDSEQEAPQDMESYMAMWKLFKQRPEFMEDMFQEYLDNSPEGQLMSMNNVDTNDYQPRYAQDKRGDVGAFAYPGENSLLEKMDPVFGGNARPRPNSDDREGAIMAQYGRPNEQFDHNGYMMDTSEELSSEEEQQSPTEEDDNEQDLDALENIQDTGDHFEEADQLANPKLKGWLSGRMPSPM